MPYSCDPTQNFLSFLKQRLHLPLGTEWSTFSFHWPLCRVMCTTACQLNALTFIHSFIQVPTIFLCSVCTKCIRLLPSKSRVNRPPPVCPRSADETKSVWASVMLLHFLPLYVLVTFIVFLLLLLLLQQSRQPRNYFWSWLNPFYTPWMNKLSLSFYIWKWSLWWIFY